MSDEPDAVRYERKGAAAVVTIDRQERRNAVDGPTAAALHEAYLRFEADEDARVLVLTGAGGIAFCAGADLKATETFAGRLMAPEGPMGFTRLTPSKPTIAAISGFCLAGGLELALWCDLRIATEGSTLGYPERRWGVPLIDGGTQRLPRIVGLGRALDLILTGRMIDAEEALAIGLLTEIVPTGAHLERALALAEGLARFPQKTMLADRRAAIEGLGMTLAEGLALEAKAGPEVFAEGQRGAQALRGRRGSWRSRRRGIAHPPTNKNTRTYILVRGMAYFVTGATGFIGRRLVELLLDKRQGKVYVLVRAGSTGRLDDLIERWGALLGVAAAKRVQPVIGDLRRPLLGVEAEQTAELRRQDRALLPPRGDLRHDRAGRAEHGDERRRHDARGRAGAGAGGQAPAPRLLDRGRRRVQGPLRGGDVRRGPEAALALPPDEVRVRADRARAAVCALARVPPGGRRRRLADRRDGQGRRARTTSSRRSSGRGS